MFHELLCVEPLDNLGVLRSEQTDQCILPMRLWKHLVHLDSPEVLLLTISQGDVTHTLVANGGHQSNRTTVFVPYWCAEAFLPGVEAEVKRAPVPPVATKIVLEPLDTELYQCDISATVSAELGKWNVLTQGTTFRVECEELGGYHMNIFVKSVEPERIVLLRGEVPLELTEPQEVAPMETPPNAQETKEDKGTDVPKVSDMFAFEDEDTPSNEWKPFQGAGRRLR